MKEQFATPEPIELYVELGSGSVGIEASDTDETIVVVEGPRAEEFTVRHADGKVSVHSPKERFGLLGGHDAHDVRVGLPTGSDLVVKTGSAAVEATGGFGTVRAKTGSGDVEVDAATGPVVLATGSGELTCAEAADGLRAKTGSGDVEVGQVAGTAAISTGSGDVEVGRSADQLVVKTGSGDVTVNRARADASLISGSGSITVRHISRGRATLKSSTGDVRVGIPAGTPVWTDISSTTGRVASNLPSAGRPGEGQDHLRLTVRTTTGDVLLAQSDDTEGRPQ
ncbi:MAG: DUF4097 family beta strand repeat-containing protein [Marmoricola sp.]